VVIVIRVELWPGGQQHHPRAHTLCEAEIWNAGGTRTLGNYGYRLFGKNRRLMREGVINGYKRISDHTWVLIRMVINAAYGGETL
jgi:hypothetical protein